MWQNKYLIISTFFKFVFGVCVLIVKIDMKGQRVYFILFFYPHLDFHAKKKKDCETQGQIIFSDS